MKHLLLIAAFMCALSARAGDKIYLFTYFTGNGQDGLHLAWSEDGYRWEALGEGRSFLKPQVGKDKLMRDPCATLGPDGSYHIVWTSGWWDNHIGHASTKDFLTWSEQQSVPVMAHEPKVRNSCAPEVIWDAKREQYLVYWASTVPGKFAETAGASEDGLNHRIYSTTTKDWKSFTPTRLFYDPGFSAIDATIHSAVGKYWMIIKDETKNPPKKHLRVAQSDDIEGPWSPLAPPFSRDWVEGPTAITRGGDTIVFFDVYREKHYGAMRSEDMKVWTDVTKDISLPKGARHGTMLTVPRALVEKLKAAKLAP